MIATSEVRVSVVIPAAAAGDALRAVHDAFELSGASELALISELDYDGYRSIRAPI